MKLLAILAAFVAVALGSPALNKTSDIGPIALYSNNCKGSSFCSAGIEGDCENAIGTVAPSATYTDQTQFSYGNCYMIYATNGAGAQPVSGQVIINTANTILSACGDSCGSYGTNNNGCSSCHVTLNYRS
ncbi:hypothetical protein PLICRDRAFT_32926 [Plicaturopsis crispa FD-325 SS-3]|uniref:Uncharacterized protein n=1 Tax=Plicaturopsis crispa FD-325 SS-3 TaxID=944288 RepID=A0A0C9T277_PLICR|nr:hypothetical protein PLICRDRAFT_32926 [Plicaturopsis crispa FD-325 SS-3]